jgi:hypothetical protein
MEDAGHFCVLQLISTILVAAVAVAVLNVVIRHENANLIEERINRVVDRRAKTKQRGPTNSFQTTGNEQYNPGLSK